MPGLLGLRERAGDVDHGQQAENVCLNETGEKVEIAGEHGGDTVGENGNSGKDARCFQQTEKAECGGDDAENQSDLLALCLPKNDESDAGCQQNGGNDPAAGGNEVDNCGGGDAQRGVNKGGDNTAARYVAEMTESHGNRLSNFGNDIHGSHYDDRFGKTLEPAEETVILDFVVPYDECDHYCPYHYAADVSRGGAEETGQTDIGAENGREEDGADEGSPVSVMLAHGFDYHLAQHHNAFFHHYLTTARSFLQITAADKAGNTDDKGNNEGGQHGLRYLYAAEYGYGEIYKRACNIKFHRYSPFFLKNSDIVIVGLTNARGRTRAITLQKPLLAKIISSSARTMMRIG